MNARLIQRAKKPTKPSKRVRVAYEIPVEHSECGSVLLLMAGLTMRQHAKCAVPLLVGDGSTVRDIIGSIRQLNVIDRQLFGSITFASDPAASSTTMLLESNHRLANGVPFFGLDSEQVFTPESKKYRFAHRLPVKLPQNPRRNQEILRQSERPAMMEFIKEIVE